MFFVNSCSVQCQLSLKPSKLHGGVGARTMKSLKATTHVHLDLPVRTAGVGVGWAEPWEWAEKMAGEVLHGGTGSGLKRRRKRWYTPGAGSEA